MQINELESGRGETERNSGILIKNVRFSLLVVTAALPIFCSFVKGTKQYDLMNEEKRNKKKKEEKGTNL